MKTNRIPILVTGIILVILPLICLVLWAWNVLYIGPNVLPLTFIAMLFGVFFIGRGYKKDAYGEYRYIEEIKEGATTSILYTAPELKEKGSGTMVMIVDGFGVFIFYANAEDFSAEIEEKSRYMKIGKKLWMNND